MTAVTLNETAAGTYTDLTGDTVLVFTDTDKKKKNIILQRDTEQGFGELAQLDEGYYENDHSPYLPVRLFLPNIRRPDQPTYGLDEIERNEKHDGAWIGDHGTLIIHRIESYPTTHMLHVMFSYDTNNELRPILYQFSPISNTFNKTEKFRPIMHDERLLAVPATQNEADVSDRTRTTSRDELDDIQQQIDQMKDQVSNVLGLARYYQTTVEGLVARVSALEQENNVPDARDMPDSNGFWRDDDGVTRTHHYVDAESWPWTQEQKRRK